MNYSKSGNPKHGDDRFIITQNFLLIENQMILARMFALSILNALGFGNHVDLGTGVIADFSPAKKDYPGTKFPYLSTNLDFRTDKDFAKLVTAARIQNLKLRKDVVLSNPLLGGIITNLTID